MSMTPFPGRDWPGTKRRVWFAGTLVLMLAMAVLHFASGMYRTTPWFMTFLQMSLPVLLVLLEWSFRRDMRGLALGTLVVPGRRLAIEVGLAEASIFVWIGFAASALRGSLASGAFVWLVPAFAVWLVWLAWTLRRARGYAFTLRPGGTAAQAGGC